MYPPFRILAFSALVGTVILPTASARAEVGTLVCDQHYEDASTDTSGVGFGPEQFDVDLERKEVSVTGQAVDIERNEVKPGG